VVFDFFIIFACVHYFTTKNTNKMAEVENAGRKGYCLMFGLIGLFLFVILVIYIYNYNGKFLPGMIF